MKLVYNGLLEFKSFYKIKSTCEVEIYKNNNRALVFIREYLRNKGISITDGLEIIIYKLFLDHQVNPEKTIYIEHCQYNTREGNLIKLINEFNLVEFEILRSISDLRMFAYEYYRYFDYFFEVKSWKKLNMSKEEILLSFLEKKTPLDIKSRG